VTTAERLRFYVLADVLKELAGEPGRTELRLARNSLARIVDSIDRELDKNG
jgi:hypothetical protein